MIHLDRNHIDHHKILSWSPLDQSFNPDDFLSDALTTVPLNGTHTSAPPSPSPTRDRSSSLSPAPESGSPIASPPLPAAAEEKEAPAVVPQREEEEEDEAQVTSRQSTPLSELSPPPDQDDEPEHGKSSEATGSESVIEQGSAPKTDVKTSDDDTFLASSPRPSTDAVTSESKPSHDSKSSSSTNYMASSSRALSIESPATPSASTSPTQKSDPKVVTILELNSELLK
jgi:hypothetical protein